MPTAAVQILCRQCSAPLPVEQGSNLVICQFCGTTNAVDKSHTVFHYAARTVLRENDAGAALRRWMAGNETVKGLDQKARIEPPVFRHVPMWLIRAAAGGREKVYLQPAAALATTSLKELIIPPSELEPYDDELDDSAVTATVPYEAMLKWLADQQDVSRSQVKETALVHVPVYEFKYHHGGRSYTALVEAAAGRVFANIFPAKWEVPYLAVAAAAFAAFFLAALVPLIGLAIGGGSGLAAGAAVYAVAVIVLGAVFIGAAGIVARQV